MEYMREKLLEIEHHSVASLHLIQRTIEDATMTKMRGKTLQSHKW